MEGQVIYLVGLRLTAYMHDADFDPSDSAVVLVLRGNPLVDSAVEVHAHTLESSRISARSGEPDASVYIVFKAMDVVGRSLIESIEKAYSGRSSTILKKPQLSKSAEKILQMIQANGSALSAVYLQHYVRILCLDFLDLEFRDALEAALDMQMRLKQNLGKDSIAHQSKVYIDSNINKAPTLEEVADYFGLSTRHLNRIFKRAFNISAGVYIQQQRLDRAVELLQNSNRSIREVAEDFGYSETGYFIRQFTKKMGRHPSTFQTKAMAR